MYKIFRGRGVEADIVSSQWHARVTRSPLLKVPAWMRDSLPQALGRWPGRLPILALG